MTPTPSPSPSPVTVLGLGAMGRALARAFLAAGHPTTVWNRSPGRADDLVADGATEAPSVAAAVAASPVTVICVLDRAGVDTVLDAAGDALDGASVVNLTSSTPDDARAIAVRARAAGARYLDGKIMVPTALVGTDDAWFIYAGDRTVFDDHLGTLRALGGDADLLGDDDGLAALHDLAMLDVFFNGMAAFLHAAALVGVDGVPARDVRPARGAGPVGARRRARRPGPRRRRRPLPRRRGQPRHGRPARSTTSSRPASPAASTRRCPRSSAA